MAEHDELGAMARGAVELARRGNTEAVRERLSVLSERVRAAGRERAALTRFVKTASACVCRHDPNCLHVDQTLRLVEYLERRPLTGDRE